MSGKSTLGKTNWDCKILYAVFFKHASLSIINFRSLSNVIFGNGQQLLLTVSYVINSMAVNFETGFNESGVFPPLLPGF